MLDYERVIYMDADNIFFHNIDNLFKCGHFCAVYMNPCNFHTGLFVVTPNNDTYKDDIYLYRAPEKVYTYNEVVASQPSEGGVGEAIPEG